MKFLLTAQGVDKRRAFWKFIEKAADVQVHDRIDTSRDDWQDQVAALVTSRARDLGLDFEPDALAIFVMLAGEQSQQIGNELEKLDLYLGPERRTITEDDVNVLVPLSRAAVVFEIGKAIQNGNAARAIQLIDQQLEADESAIGIMRASIIGVVRNLYLAKLIVEQIQGPDRQLSGLCRRPQPPARKRPRLAAAEKGRQRRECLPDLPRRCPTPRTSNSTASSTSWKPPSRPTRRSSPPASTTASSCTA